MRKLQLLNLNMTIQENNFREIPAFIALEPKIERVIVDGKKEVRNRAWRHFPSKEAPEPIADLDKV